MRRMVPHDMSVCEVPGSVGWYMVRLRIDNASMEMLTNVDGLDMSVQSYLQLGNAEREGYARQALELAIANVNTCLLAGSDVQLVVPKLRFYEKGK